MPDKKDNPRNTKPISLHPLSVEEALRRAMMAGKPKAEQQPNKRADDQSKRGRKGKSGR